MIVDLKNKPLTWIIIAVALIVVVGIAAYQFGKRQVLPAPAAVPVEQIIQQEVQKQLQSIQQETDARLEEEVAKTNNPFQATNPLEDAKTNPFEETRKKLNPFE